jgi:hypothetical protein
MRLTSLGFVYQRFRRTVAKMRDLCTDFLKRLSSFSGDSPGLNVTLI